MLHGKYWLIPPDQVVNTSRTEHSQYAKKFLLGIKDGDEMVSGIRPFNCLNMNQVVAFSARGVPIEILNFLSKHEDPRWYMIENYNWVRVAYTLFNVWKFDLKTVQMIQAAKQYWEEQITEVGDMMDFSELSSKKPITMSIKKFYEIKTEQDCLALIPDKFIEE